MKEGGYLYVHLINSHEDAWKGQNNGLEHSHSYYMNGKTNIDNIKVGDPFTKVSTYDSSISENNFNFIAEYKDGEQHWYSVHLDSKKLFLITYEDSKSIDKIKQSNVKTISEKSKKLFSPEELREHNYEYNYNILEIDL